MKLIIVLCAIFWMQIAYCKDYTGYKTYRVTFEKHQVEELRALVDDIEGTEYWLFSTVRGITDIFTPPNVEKKLIAALKKNGFNYFVLHEDVQELIDESEKAD